MFDWIVHGVFRRWPSVRDQGHARLIDSQEGEPVHDVPIAGFARPLPDRKGDEQDSKETVD